MLQCTFYQRISVLASFRWSNLLAIAGNHQDYKAFTDISQLLRGTPPCNQYLLFNGPVTNHTELLFLKRPKPTISEPKVQGRAKRHFKPPLLHTTEKDYDVDCHSAFARVGSSFLGYGRVGRQRRWHQMQSRQVILRNWTCPSFRLHTQGKLS